MDLARFDPLRELETISERLSRVAGRAFPPLGETDGLTAWSPAVDVEETDKEYLVKADLPDVGKADVKVALERGILTVDGERRQEKEEKGRKFHRLERAYGRFVRRLAVPTDVDEQGISAEFKDGVLRVHLPKSASAKPHSIDIKVA